MEEKVYRAYTFTNENSERNFFAYFYQWLDGTPENSNFDFYFEEDSEMPFDLTQSNLIYVGKFRGDPQTRIFYRAFKNRSCKKQKC